MKSKLDQLNEKAAKLDARLSELRALRERVREDLRADPLGAYTASMSQKIAAYDVQIQNLTEVLAEAQAEADQERARINSPEARQATKSAEKTIADCQKSCHRIGAQLAQIAEDVETVIAACNDAAKILNDNGRDGIVALGFMPPFLDNARAHLGAWRARLGTATREYIE